LCIACANANWSIAAFLLESGARPEAARAQPALLFAAAVADDDPAGVRLLLKHRARADARAALERTPLMAAALAGHPRIVETLLGAGADVDLADERGTTALMEAARSGSVAVIHALGKRKPDPDRRDASGRTALIIACQSRHAGEEAVRALLALGADRELQGGDGRRGLDPSAAAGRMHKVALLDSAYPLPSSFGEAVPAQRANADHLLDALRFGHWNVAAEFVGVLGEWPAEALASMYLELTGEDEAPARQWLLNHRLGTDEAVHADGRLLDALVERLPASCMALGELVGRGVPVGGAGLVGRVLARAPVGASGAGVRRLALGLLERGADAFGCVADGQSPLHFAVQAGDRALVDRLLAGGAHPDARDAQGRTPLHVAATTAPADDCSLVRRLVAAGSNPEIATAQGETALGIALARAQPDAAAWLGWSGWPLPLRPLRPSDLPAAAHVGDGDAVDRLLQLGFAIDSEEAQGATALVRAAGAGHAALVVCLLGAGADPAHASHGGVHCLAAAVSARREPVVRTLLSHGMAPDTRLAGAATPLMLAAALGDPRIAEALLEAGADPKASDGQGTTPLHAAAQQAFHASDTAAALALFSLLLEAGADPRAVNRAGQDPLLLLLGAAAQPGTRCDADHLRRLAECLLERGAGVEVQDQRGVSALHACALHGLSGCARLLKSHGAPLDAVDGFGRNAADVAALLGYVDVAAELGLARALPLPGARQTLRRPARAPD
jgi:ankyrin repeat protein